MRILLTGAAGFIGSHLTERLIAGGTEVVGLDNFDAFYPRGMKEANLLAVRDKPGFRLFEADVRDRDFLDRIPGHFDAIVHLAAKAGVRQSILDAIEYQAVNVGGTQNLLEFAKNRGVSQFVFASSSSVYGVNPDIPWREDQPVLMPISPYASTKISGELLGHVYSHLYGFRFLALRFFTVYGPRQRPDLAIRKFAELMLDGRPIQIFGDGSTRRDYTFIGDIVRGIVEAIGYTDSQYEVVNLGNNRTVTLLEMIRTLEAALGVKARLEWLPEQAGDVQVTFADTAKARRLLGYGTGTPFSEGIGRLVQWMRSAQGASAEVCARTNP